MNFGAFDADLIEATFYSDLTATLNGEAFPTELPEDVASVSVYAIGGGTIGRSYTDSAWAYRVTFTDGTVEDGTDLYSAPSINHMVAAQMAAEFLTKTEWISELV